VVLSLFFGTVQAQNHQGFEPKTKTQHIMFAVSAVEHDSDFVAAIAYINEALAMDSACAFCFSFRANIYLLQKEYSLALSDFGKAFLFDAEDLSNLLGRAKCYYFLKNYEKSLEDLNQAVATSLFDADVYLWRSKVKKVLGDNIGSESDLKTYNRLNGQ
ncbi:MAG: hypothetical protein WCJ57_04635, partial [Candidatus Falkowbacteria bacterium]